MWVTGASKGIGRAIAVQFARLGCTVCVSARSKKLLQGVVRQIESEGGKAIAFPHDARNSGSAARTARAIGKQVGPVTVLVNNAGVTRFKTIQRTSAAEAAEILSVNLMFPILCTQSVLPGMTKRRAGWVFNILSRAAVRTFEQSGLYTASKEGLYGFGKVLREEMRTKGIRVVNIIPGPVDTEMWSPGARSQFRKRMMTPESVAVAVCSLYTMPPDIVAEELRLRPLLGDID